MQQYYLVINHLPWYCWFSGNLYHGLDLDPWLCWNPCPWTGHDYSFFGLPDLGLDPIILALDPWTVDLTWWLSPMLSLLVLFTWGALWCLDWLASAPGEPRPVQFSFKKSTFLSIILGFLTLHFMILFKWWWWCPQTDRMPYFCS